MRPPATNKLAKLTLKLIEKDLRRIAKESQLAAAGEFAPTLARYLLALLNHKRTTEKVEDEQRKALSKLSTKELRELAGVKE